MSRSRHSAEVENPDELRMGSPQYGRLLVDGQPIPDVGSVESESLVWSADGRRLAAQELTSSTDGPETRIVVIDVERHARLTVSPPAAGLCTPLRFEDDVLFYRHWHHVRGTSELRLVLPR